VYISTATPHSNVTLLKSEKVDTRTSLLLKSELPTEVVEDADQQELEQEDETLQ
jgi:hypothetical protein